MRIAVLQLNAKDGHVDENITRSLEYLERTGTECRADIAVLPELITTGWNRDAAANYAERIPGPASSAWSVMAQRHGMVVVGGLSEAGDDGHVYNSAVVLGPDGQLATYRKLLRFDWEQHVFAEGAGVVACDTPHGRIAPLICYDLYHAWPALVAAFDRSADVLCVPANPVSLQQPYRVQEPGEPYQNRTEGAARQRAAETGVYVAVASGGRRSYKGVTHLPRSMIIGPGGRMLTREMEGEGILWADIKPEAAAYHRERQRRESRYDACRMTSE